MTLISNGEAPAGSPAGDFWQDTPVISPPSIGRLPDIGQECLLVVFCQENLRVTLLAGRYLGRSDLVSSQLNTKWGN